MMENKILGFVLVAIFSIGACGDDGPCLDSGGGEGVAGETGGPTLDGCALDEKFTHGSVLACQGAGSGWLVTDVYGAGKANPITTCLAYEDPLNVPKNPTSEDCASISLDKIPFDIPAPAACCNDEASEDSIITTCEDDCGFAACKTAIAAIRASADELAPPPGAPEIVEKAFDTSRADLYAYADMLEAPVSLNYCGEKVAAGAGGIIALGLGGGVSNSAAFGHIKDATLYLGCSLRPDEPYVPLPSAGECSGPINIPKPTAEQDAGGPIQGGAVTVTGPGVDSVAKIHNATATTREVLDGDMSVDFILTSFEADVVGVAVGSFALRDAHISLVGPASGPLVGDTVTFAPGTLRFAVSAAVYLQGEPLFGGLPMIAEYGNDAPATAVRGLEGSFHFEQATFIIGAYTAVLSTEPSVLVLDP